MNKEIRPRSNTRYALIAPVVAASLAMAATLPGRTHGLGVITTRVISDFEGLDETGFAQINLVATLVGSLLCLPCGLLIDRVGSRWVAGAVLVALGFVVLWMSGTTSLLMFCIAITLTRGIGQSMLSVVSLAIIGKSFPSRSGLVMGAYAVLLTFIMAAWTGLLTSRVSSTGWRAAWGEVGWSILALSPIVWFLTPRLFKGLANNQSNNLESKTNQESKTRLANGIPESNSASLGQAISTPCFWVFALGISLFGMISSGVSLFQQSILESKGLSESLYHTSLVLGLLIGLAANIAGGWLAMRYRLQDLLGVSLLLLAISLVCLPFITTEFHAYTFCVVYSLAGGMITVLFFSVWGQAFGTGALARIQGAAQMMTVVASSLGPLLVTQSNAMFGTYDPIFWAFACACSVLGLVSLCINVPSYARGDWSGYRIEA